MGSLTTDAGAARAAKVQICTEKIWVLSKRQHACCMVRWILPNWQKRGALRMASNAEVGVLLVRRSLGGGPMMVECGAGPAVSQSRKSRLAAVAAHHCAVCRPRARGSRRSHERDDAGSTRANGRRRAGCAVRTLPGEGRLAVLGAGDSRAARDPCLDWRVRFHEAGAQNKPQRWRSARSGGRDERATASAVAWMASARLRGWSGCLRRGTARGCPWPAGLAQWARRPLVFRLGRPLVGRPGRATGAPPAAGLSIGRNTQCPWPAWVRARRAAALTPSVPSPVGAQPALAQGQGPFGGAASPSGLPAALHPLDSSHALPRAPEEPQSRPHHRTPLRRAASPPSVLFSPLRQSAAASLSTPATPRPVPPCHRLLKLSQASSVPIVSLIRVGPALLLSLLCAACSSSSRPPHFTHSKSTRPQPLEQSAPFLHAHRSSVPSS
ncbi:hypothetical protein PSPO01_00494 [Paraphaeosphaeria sporulosa]